MCVNIYTMKKFIAFLLIAVIAINANAQVQRKHTQPAGADSATAAKASVDKMGRKDMLHELNLTKQQRLKMKALRQEGKAKMDAIKNDSKLSDSERTEKIKALKKEQMDGTMSVLNDEQKTKLKQMRKEKKGGKKGDKKDDMTMEEQ